MQLKPCGFLVAVVVFFVYLCCENGRRLHHIRIAYFDCVRDRIQKWKELRGIKRVQKEKKKKNFLSVFALHLNFPRVDESLADTLLSSQIAC